MNFLLFLVLITIVCFLLIVVIMVQNPKGGGLSSSLGGTQMMGGVQRTTDFLDKSTWTLGAVLIGLILISALAFQNGRSSDSKLLNNIQNTPATQAAPAPIAPTTEAPAAPTTEAPAETPAQ